MQPEMISKTVTNTGKNLLVHAASLQKGAEPYIPESINGLWKVLAPFIKFERQLVYIRDMVEQSIDGKWIGGWAPNGKEVFINLPHWKTGQDEFTDSLAHELHHLARYQNGGYGTTLGRVLVTEGMACWFAETQSGWQAPWIQEDVSPKIWENVLKEWDSQYNHPEWFINGPLGKWVGYRTGYRIVKAALNDKFDLRKSVFTEEATAKKSIPV